MSPRNHVIVTGTGRAGTSFLVELLTRLGQDTGFSANDLVSKKCRNARAGLEHDVRSSRCPYIVKSPQFCDHAEEVIRRDDIVIDHMFIPIRDLGAAAESRRHVERTASTDLPLVRRLIYRLGIWPPPGGLWRTHSTVPGEQESVLSVQIYNLVLALADTSVPVTFLRYPRLVTDGPYLFSKLNPVLQNVSSETFASVFGGTSRPELVHQFNEHDC
ncbi:MAG: hypothetical protein RIK87_16410 [Fuerstiella sp.]